MWKKDSQYKTLTDWRESNKERTEGLPFWSYLYPKSQNFLQMLHCDHSQAYESETPFWRYKSVYIVA